MTYPITQITQEDRNHYPQAIQKALKDIAAAGIVLKVASWLTESVLADGIRLLDRDTLPAGDYTLDFGDTFQGKSPEYALSHTPAGYYFVPLLQYLRLILVHPELVEKNYYLDFPLDELRGGQDFSDRPFLYRVGDEAWLGGFYAGFASEDFGSLGCAWEGTSDLGDLGLRDYLVFGGKKYRLEEVK